MALPRESAFMPTIKCSQCGNEVEISLMGEHLCNAPATPELSPPLEAEETFSSVYQATRTKYPRTPPPVDTGAANLYLSQGQLTPVSHASSSRDTSPKTPSRRSEASRRYNDDYAPKIANPDDGQQSPRGYGPRPGGYGGFGSQTPEPESTEASEPPQKVAPATSFFQRVGELAGGYGGFGARPAEPAAKLAETPIPEKPAEAQAEPEPATEAPGFLQRINNLAGAAFDAGRRPPAPESPILPESPVLPEFAVAPANNEQKPSLRKNGYGGFNEPTFSDNDVRGMPRAETFSRPSTSNDATGLQPTGLGLQSDVQRRPSAPLPRTGDVSRKSSMRPDTTRRPPPRTSLIKHSASSSSVDLDKEFGVRNPYHTPTDSMSSGYSSHSDHSNLAPIKSNPDRFMQRNNSEPAARPRPPPPQQAPKPDNNPPPRRTDKARPDLRIDPAIQAPRREPARVVEPPYSVSPRDDRYDPAIQSGLPGSRRGANTSNPRSDRYGATKAPPSAPVRQGSRDGLHPPSSRGDCKACGAPITGKSISSADGRLTGKYHKACFTCTTCARPFSSAVFYVHRDRPYCEAHYHKLNGSLCGACDRGIEGTYAEDEARVKYHVGCFRCLDCGVSLSDGYFEVDGKSYCERDAWRRVESEAAPPLSPPALLEASHGSRSSSSSSGSSQALAKATAAPPKSSSGGRGGLAGRGVGAGMERGPYGVAPRGRLNKRMTRLGEM